MQNGKSQKKKKKCLALKGVNFDVKHLINTINTINCRYFESLCICPNNFKMLGISHKFPLRKNKAKLSELWAINIWGLGLKAQIDNNDTVQMKMTIVLNGADLMPNNGLNLCD